MKTTDMRHWMCRNAFVDTNDGSNGALWKCGWKHSLNNTVWIKHTSGCWPHNCEYCKSNPENKHFCLDCPCEGASKNKSGCLHIEDDGTVTYCDVGYRVDIINTINDRCFLRNKSSRSDWIHPYDQITGGCPMFALRTKEEVAEFLEMVWKSIGTQGYPNKKLSSAIQKNGKPSVWVKEAEAFCGQPIITKRIEKHLKKCSLKKKEKE